MDTRQSRGIQAAVLAFVMWGVFTAYWKQLSGLSAWQLIGWRVMIATILMAAFCALTARWTMVTSALSDRALLPSIAAASGLLVVNWTSYVWAVANDRVVETALGYFLAPLFTMLIGIFVLGERKSTERLLAVGSTCIAIAILIYSYGAIPWAGLMIATSWSLYAVVKRQIPLGPFVSLTSELLLIFVPAVGVSIYSLITLGGIGEEAAAWQWPLVVGTGLITVLPLLLFGVAAQRIPFTLLGALNFIVPIINFTLGWAVYGEPMPMARLVGFAFVWAALVLMTVDTFRRQPAGYSPLSVTDGAAAAGNTTPIDRR